MNQERKTDIDSWVSMVEGTDNYNKHKYGYRVEIDNNNKKHKYGFVKVTDIRGIIIRCKDNCSYYFNNEGIYSVTERLKSDRIPHFAYNSTIIFGEKNEKIIKKAIPQLQLGDHISKLIELIDILKIEKKELPKGLDRFLTLNSTDMKFEREPENKKINTFDRIRITCRLISSQDFFDELNDEKINNIKSLKGKQKAYIIKNKNKIIQIILDKLNASKNFSKYGITINFLRLASCRLNNDSTLELIFELKQLKQDKSNRINKENKGIDEGGYTQ